MSKHIEAEGGEMLIKSSNGYMAIVPKNMTEWVKEHIKSGNHAAVDHFVKGLKELKPGSKAQDGGKMRYGKRPTGEYKDVGFIGEQTTPSGKNVVTEFSIGTSDVNGKQMDIPTMVPTLSESEKNYILQRADADENIGFDPIGNSIYKKSVAHARQRIAQGKSPFYSSAEFFPVEPPVRPIAPIDALRIK